MKEYDIQKMCITWFRLQHPQMADLLFSIPNSQELSYKNRKMAAIIVNKLKAAGLTPGIPDLMLAVPRNIHLKNGDGLPPRNRFYPGLFIEMKVPGRKPGNRQQYVIDQLKDQGYKVEVITSLDDFIELISNYL